ncbi:MAG: CHASE3 domain-containing protein [Rhodospirillum sp.]|nr:CHASE3 domain-containing protein [Rhodospirillum sp.]MCF8490649.1 CHASE3 domain-containing protein [Rhodospirillum sp.]MCF8500721.1 CHASE3 domain-containing protein [Rhodospirillum sp.]
MNWSSVRTKPKILVGVAIPTVLMVLLGILSLSSIGRIVETVGWVDHTNVVIGHANDIVASAVDMETGMRGYLLAGKEEFLVPYVKGQKAFQEQINALKEIVSDNPPQVERLNEVESILKEWRETVAEEAIAMRREIGDAATMNDVSAKIGTAEGKAFIDKFRDQIATFIARKESLLDEHQVGFARLLTAPTISSNDVRDAVGLLNQTFSVISQARALVATVLDMETGARGYLLAGKEAFLDPYKAGAERFSALTKKLRGVVADDPEAVQLLTDVDGTISAWREQVIKPLIALRRDIGDAKTMDDMARLVGQARGKVFFDKFRGIMAEFVGEETALMEVRKQRNLDTERGTTFLIIAGIITALVLGGGGGLLIGDSIAKPIRAMTDVMVRLAHGDKTAEIPATERRDEVGEMAASVVVFKDSMLEAEGLARKEAEDARAHEERARKIEIFTRDFDTSVSKLLEAVSQSAKGMERTATSMSSIADDTKHRATTVATAAEEASANVETVAAATEELASSIQEIARQVAQSSSISSRAVEEANKTDRQVQGLADSASRIGEVINLISDIADQTNLLALNATIEAARAGDAGKGFAVVANEVKSLANQTGKATEEISQQINAIQAETQNAVAAIKSIGATINESNAVASAIASAVEEQEAATQEIARNVEQASAGTREVTLNILGVTRAAGETDGAAEEVNAAALEMNGKAGDLRDRIEAFLAEVRSV